MKTKKQEELINLYLSTFEETDRTLYLKIILYLSELGYNPQKQRSNIVFKHDSHSKQIGKMGLKKDLSPFFQLRFSACRGYSARFDSIVGDAVSKKKPREANCLKGECNWCAGEPLTHVYIYTAPNGEKKYHCGAVPLEIPHITANDIEEIKRLIYEEHVYLMKHQAGITI